MKIVLMTTPFFFVEESQILTALFDEGLELLHLRKPDTEPVFSERLLSLIPESYHRRIVTHDHFYLKNEYGLRGVHLNDRNLELPDGFKGTISCSCYTVEEIEARRRKMDYVFLQSTDFNVHGNSGRVLRTRCRKKNSRRSMFRGASRWTICLACAVWALEVLWFMATFGTSLISTLSKTIRS